MAFPYVRAYADWKNANAATGGGDTSTPITEATLDLIEAGIVSLSTILELVSTKGDLLVATGNDAYARKGAGSNDTLLTAASGQSDGLIWQLLTNASVDAAAAIAVSKIAGGSSGQFLKTVGSTPTWSAAPVPSLTAALPGSPSDGDEIVYVDSLSAPTFAWHLRYISAKSSNKWQYVGGSPKYAEITTSESTTSTSYVALTTAGPSIAVPLAGDYHVEIGAFSTGPAAGALSLMSYDIGGTGAVDADGISVVSSGVKVNAARARAKAGLTAVTLTAKYKTASGTGTWQDRWMRLTPIAVQ